MLRQLCAVFFAAAIAAASSGCSSQAQSGEDETTTDLRSIARAYDSVIGMRRKPPRSVDEIKQVLVDFHDVGWVGPPDEVLISSRDGQPYVIILDVDLGAEISKDVLAYEKKGAEGKRYVLLTSRDVIQMTDDEFAQASFAQRHKPTGE
ncbi:MAG: hypothetical protein L0211_13390 [Planctomycetaceae bacterium]|nr:hypothetical protein [Planctomycetaceae bacterium]